MERCLVSDFHWEAAFERLKADYPRVTEDDLGNCREPREFLGFA